MLSHDDWGSKNQLFVSPETWREFIKPQYAKTYGYMKEKGVIIIHHGDSFMEPVVEDMVELGVDVWQGVLPQNDIPKLQKSACRKDDTDGRNRRIHCGQSRFHRGGEYAGK